MLKRHDHFIPCSGRKGGQNRSVPSYIRAQADLIRSFVAEGGGQGADLLFLMYAVLLRAKGAGVTASDVHDVWSAWAESEGPVR
jgi:hypothetical protein